MGRLLEDAEKLSGIEYDISSYSDIVDAIHVVQTEMGITGTTAKEAGTTIQGSISSMKSAWENLLTGLADGNANIERLIDNLVTTVVGDGTETNLGVLGNVIPAVRMALQGAAKVVAQSAPIIAEELPKLMEEILPYLASATANLIVALAWQIPSMAQTLVDAAYQIVDEIGNVFAERIPGLSIIFENLETVVISLTAAFVAYKAATAISGIIDALRKATEGQTIAQTLLNAVMNANPFVLIATLIAGLVTAVITLWNTNDGFREAVINAWGKIKEFISASVSTISNFFTVTIPQAGEKLVSWFKAIPERFKEIGKNIVNGVWQGIQSMVSWFTNKVKSFFSGIVNSVKNVLGIHSPSKVFASIGGYMAEGLGEGFDNEFSDIKKNIENSMNFDAGTITADANIGGHYISGSYRSANTIGVGDSGRIVMLLEQYLPMLANMKVIMDSGQVVGLLAPGMDAELAKINARRARSV